MDVMEGAEGMKSMNAAHGVEGIVPSFRRGRW